MKKILINDSIKDDKPFTYSQILQEIKTDTNNFTKKDGEFRYGYEEEAKNAVKILRNNYNVDINFIDDKSSPSGETFIVKFSKTQQYDSIKDATLSLMSYRGFTIRAFKTYNGTIYYEAYRREGSNNWPMYHRTFKNVTTAKRYVDIFLEKGELASYNFAEQFALFRDSIKDVKPKEGESKEDFISRFMSETKSEYPDEKQRLAVAHSYWNKQHDYINDMGYVVPGRRIPAHNEYSNRISYNDLINTFNKVMQSASDGDVKILIGQLEELKKDYETDINNKSLDYNETKMHYKKYKDIVNKYKNSKISNEFSKAINNFENSLEILEFLMNFQKL